MDYSNMLGSDFLISSHLCREPMPPMKELKADMEILKSHGFNGIKLQEHWQVDEPVEGECDFSRYEELIEHAAKLDLSVHIALTMEQAPHWLYEKHPDCRLVGHDGRRVQYEAVNTMPSDGKPGPCFDHPGARQEQRRFIQTLVGRLGRYDNVIAWDIWQEISTNIWSSGMSEMLICFCDHTLGFFREWLKGRHGDLDALNKAWNTRYSRWEEICPERRSVQGPLAVNIEWQYFFDNVQVARVLEDRYEAVKSADLRNRPVFAHRGAPDIGSPRDWNFTRKLDFMGSSCYALRGASNAWDDNDKTAGVDPAIPILSRDMQGMVDEIMLRFDHVRSCNPPGAPVWAAEFQGGPKNYSLLCGTVPTRDHIRRWMLASAAYGVTDINFWVTRAEIMAFECNGFGLLDMGISTILCTPTATPPRWLTASHEDWFRVDSDGRRMVHGSRQHCCTTNPEFRIESERITRVMADHYAGNPYVIGWQIDNELHCHIGECYCDACLSAFRLWLKAQYGPISVLNSAWGTAFWAQTYDSFEHIGFPYIQRRPASCSPSNLLDYKRFISDAARQFQAGLVKPLREANRKWWITHNGLFPAVDYWKCALDLDLPGVDLYPGFALQGSEGADVFAYQNELGSAGGGGRWMHVRLHPPWRTSAAVSARDEPA